MPPLFTKLKVVFDLQGIRMKICSLPDAPKYGLFSFDHKKHFPFRFVNRIKQYRNSCSFDVSS